MLAARPRRVTPSVPLAPGARPRRASPRRRPDDRARGRSATVAVDASRRSQRHAASTQTPCGRRSRCRRRPVDVHAPGATERGALRGDVVSGASPAPISHCASAGVQAAGDRVLARRRPTATKARTSNCASSCSAAGHGPTTPSSSSPIAAQVGLQRQHRLRAESSSTAHPAGAVVDPLGRAQRVGRDAQAARDLRDDRRLDQRPLRRSGGAANASRAPSRRMRTRPTPHCCTISPPRGWPPAASQAWQLPSVGWPANGSSRAGVKMRTR